MAANILMQFKWTKSRAEDTYGYNICSLWVNEYKVASTVGGGYDMQGVVLAKWLVKNFQKELQSRFKTKEDLKDFYGARLDKETGAVSMDGACGFLRVIDLANAVGIYFKCVHKNSNNAIYIVTIEDDKT